MNPEVDPYFSEAEKWREELKALRAIVLDCQLTEERKWGVPCYTFQKSNLILLGTFKDYCAFTFCKGALLKDAQGVLAKPGENSQSARLIRFTTVAEIVEMEPVLKSYILEAIEAEKSGLKVEYKKSDDFEIPEELQNRLDGDPALKTAFAALTPGRRRGYVLYISAAKQSQSRASRVETHVQRILDGKGIHDCICGHTKRPPNCDGSHKFY